MTDNAQFPDGWKSDTLGNKVGGPFFRPKRKNGPKDLNDRIARERGKTHAVTAAADVDRRKRRMFPPKRRPAGG